MRSARKRLGFFFASSVAVFVLAVGVGYASGGGSTGDDGGITLSLGLVEILLNNTVVYALLLLGGATFGLASVFFLFTTGTVLGAAIEIAIREGIDPTAVVLLIAPHGVFELPAFFLAAAVGFDTAWRITTYLAGKRRVPMSRQCVWEYATLVVAGYAALALAAIIESTVTAELAHRLG